jgi:KUP system potassium uptake protein
VLGFVLLVVAGATVLYSGLGRFGRKPTHVVWLCLALPAILVNYMGQAALLLTKPETLDNLFYNLYPHLLLGPLLILATGVAIIAGHGIITGAFSIARQAIQLGLLPRLDIRHTTESTAHIYVPRVNWLLFTGALVSLLAFQSSSSVAAAYGLTIGISIVVDSIMLQFLVWRYWGWSFAASCAVTMPLLLIEQMYLAASMLKLPMGGWVFLTTGLFCCVVMLTWVRGSTAAARSLRRYDAKLEWLVRKLKAKPVHRVPGTAVYLTSAPEFAPAALYQNLLHNRVLHERNIILTIRTEDTPRVAGQERISFYWASDDFTVVTARCGFMETPSVPRVLEDCRRRGLNIDIAATSFFLSRRSLKVSPRSDMPFWQARLFIAVAASRQDATHFFRIPADRVIGVETPVVV